MIFNILFKFMSFSFLTLIMINKTMNFQELPKIFIKNN